MKKIILVAIMFMLFAGVVSAAVNGEYKGKPIVKLKSNGQVLAVEDAPAVIMDSRTMVPISMLRQIGLGVEWNAEEYSVDVTLPEIDAPKEDEVTNLMEFIESAKRNLANNGIEIVQYNLEINEQGMFLYAIYDIDYLTNEKLIENITLISSLISVVESKELDGAIIETRSQGLTTGSIVIGINSIDKFTDRLISREEFTNSWDIDITSPSTTETNQSSEALCNIINKKYDDLIRSTEEEFGSRNMARSTMLTDSIDSIEEDRVNELTLYGCPQ